jgi:predicted component of type VI protein secretion system
LPEDTIEGLAEENKDEFTGVIAYYRDQKNGVQKPVTTGDQRKSKRVRWLYATESTAKRAADREWKKLQREKP